MSLDVFSIKDYIKAGTSSVNVDEHYTFDELPLTEPSHVKATIKIHSAGVQVVGHFTAHSDEPCDRCNQPYERSLDNDFDESYVFQEYATDYAGGELELQSLDFFEVLDEEAMLDLKDMIYQLIVMELSLNRICNSPTCDIHGKVTSEPDDA